MKIKIYGSRGSTAYFAENNRRRGGNTACVLMEINGRKIVFDCGSGLLVLNRELQASGGIVKLDMFITHLHVDHIVGLPAFTPLYDPRNDIRLYTISRIADMSIGAQIFGPFKPPYWPVDMAELNRSECVEIRIGEPVSLGDGIRVTPFSSPHPDNTTAFILETDKKIVYLCDCEIKDDILLDKMAEHCKDADCLIFDTAYMPDDYPPKHGWGHSTYEIGLRLAEKSNCKQMILTHFDQSYDDKRLAKLARKLSVYGDKFIMAHDGLELEL